MRYLIIGLGIYGANLARDLVAQGHEVIGVDSSRTTIDAIKDYITTAYTVDTTEESALAVLPLRNVDVVIVAIGENFGASVKTVALLKKAGVKQIYARAIDELHESILQSFNVAHILRPEQRAAADLTHEMALGSDVDSMAVTDKSYILKFNVPAFFVGMAYKDLRLEQEYGLKLIAVARLVKRTNVLGVSHPVPELLNLTDTADLTVAHGDILVTFGTAKAYRALYRHIE